MGGTPCVSVRHAEAGGRSIASCCQIYRRLECQRLEKRLPSLVDELTKEAPANFSKALADVTESSTITDPIADEFDLFLRDKARAAELAFLFREGPRKE
jgi:hypothetical protein